MKNLILLSIALLAMTSAYAKKNCTDQAESQWMKVKKFKTLVKDKGYTIRKFKQTGTCYEIYGKNKDGRKVEVYFNPVDASVKKVEFEN